MQFKCLSPHQAVQWLTVEGELENKDQSKTEGKGKKSRLSLRVFFCEMFGSVIVCTAALCLHVHVSYPGFLSGVCGSLAPISPLEQSGTGRLAAQERKQPLSNSRWRTACAYTAETHIHAGTHTWHSPHIRYCTTVAFITALTQIAHNKCQLQVFIEFWLGEENGGQFRVSDELYMFYFNISKDTFSFSTVRVRVTFFKPAIVILV